jgi:hypothetical protein
LTYAWAVHVGVAVMSATVFVAIILSSRAALCTQHSAKEKR